MSGFPKNTFGGTLSFLIVLVHIPYIYIYIWNKYIWNNIYTYGIFLERANVMIHIQGTETLSTSIFNLERPDSSVQPRELG